MILTMSLGSLLCADKDCCNGADVEAPTGTTSSKSLFLLLRLPWLIWLRHWADCFMLTKAVAMGLMAPTGSNELTAIEEHVARACKPIKTGSDSRGNHFPPRCSSVLSAIEQKYSAFLPIPTSEATSLVEFSLSLFCEAEEQGRHLRRHSQQHHYRCHIRPLVIITLIAMFPFTAIIRAITRPVTSSTSRSWNEAFNYIRKLLKPLDCPPLYLTPYPATWPVFVLHTLVLGEFYLFLLARGILLAFVSPI